MIQPAERDHRNGADARTRDSAEINGSRVVAIGEKAANGASSAGSASPVSAAAGASEVEFLGHLIWYSLAETRIQRGALAGAIAAAGLPEEKYLPREISPRDAFRRATASMEAVKVPIKLTNRQRLFGAEVGSTDSNGVNGHANIMVREVASNEDSIIRQVVREEVDSENVRLSYAPVAQIELHDRDSLRAQALTNSTDDLLPAEREMVERVRERFHFEYTHYDSNAIRRLIGAVMKEGSPVSMRASGGVYFISRHYEETTNAVAALIEALKEHASSSGKTTVTAVPLMDAENHREALAESLEEQVAKRGRSLINEMSQVLKSGRKISEKRQQEYVERVRELAGMVKEYEGLLEREISDARNTLELAHEEAVSLMQKARTE